MRTLFTGAFEGNSTEKVAGLYYTEYTVEVTADQVRELRTPRPARRQPAHAGAGHGRGGRGSDVPAPGPVDPRAPHAALAIAAVTLAAAAAVGLYFL